MGGDRGSTTARTTLNRDWGGPQVRDPTPIVSVNPEADPPQPRAPVRPNRAEQDGETAEEKSQEHKKYVKRETEHLCLRQLMHGMGRDPRVLCGQKGPR